MSRATAIALLLVTSSCGYRSVAARSGSEKLSVVLVSSNVPDAVASDEVLAGVRDELARAGALESGNAYPRCEVEVLRADEASEGIAATPNADERLIPEARATRVGIVARAWVVRSKDAPHERDTGDVRALDVVATAPDAKTATYRHADSLRAAARRAGRRIAARLLGLPSASEE